MTTGVLPFDELKRKVHMVTGFFETSQYTEDAQMSVTSGNHDNAGLSIGNLQYNFGPADRAQEWFKYMIDNQRAIVDAAFGANTTQRDTFINVINTYTRADRITWGDSISVLVNGEKRALAEPYKTAFGNMLITAEGKIKYYSMRDAYYWNPIYELFRHMTCNSRAACASLFDTYVNKGRYYPVNLLQADFDRIDADAGIDEIEKERQKIYAINFRGNYDNAVNPNLNAWGYIDQDTFWHGDGVDDGRRGCMANQEGVYYGAVYDPENQFDINQEPATTEKAGAQPLNVNLGTLSIENAYLGNTPIQEIYLGATLIGGGVVEPYTSSRVPTTQFRTNPASYAGIGAVTEITLNAGQPLWIDVQEPFVSCRTYYTTDGSTPTTASTVYTDALTFTESVILKVLSVSVFGIAAAVKTLNVNMAAAAPITTISPSEVIQNNIPLTISLSTSEVGATIYYKIGSSATVNTYTAPFVVNQTTAGVLSHLIKITYWSVGASATEIEKSITYDTSGAIPAQPVVGVVAGAAQIALDWEPTLNTTSYTVYRSTVQGEIGAILAGAQYIAPTNWTDTTAAAGITYYYTVQAGNYARATNSAQVSGALEEAAPPPQQAAYRYLKIEGYGSVEEPVTTRMVEVEAWEGAVNRMSAATILSNQAVSTGGTVAAIKDGLKPSTGYPIWWTATPNANIVIDLLAERPLTKLNYYSYSITGTQRANRFRILGSNTNNGVDWAILWDMSANTTPQPILPNGYEYIMPAPVVTETFNMNFYGKLKNDFGSNPHYAGGVGMQGQVMPTPEVITTQGFEISGANYTKFGAEENNPTNTTTFSVMSDTSRLNNYYRWDIITALEAQQGAAIWGGAVTVAEKMVIVKERITGMTVRHNGFGSGGGLNFAVWDGAAYSTPIFKDNGTNTNIFTSLEWDITADMISNDGYIHTLIFTPDGASTTLKVDYIEVQVTAIK